MSRYKRLGGTASYIDFEDESKYKVVRASEQETVTYAVVEEPIRNMGSTNLGMSRATSRDLSFECLVRGSSWTGVLANLNAIGAVLGSAQTYSMLGSGVRVTYRETQGDQSSPTSYNVIRGEVVEVRSKRLVPRLYTFAQVKLHMEPDPL